MICQTYPIPTMNDTTSAYLAGYLERGGAIRIYINRGSDDTPVIETGQGSTVPIESAGIYIRVRASDMTVLRMLKEVAGGKLSPGQWQGWNDDAATVLRAIGPYLKTGKRKAVVSLVLEFHEFMEEKREEAMGGASCFTVEDVEAVVRYDVTLREITGSK